MKYKGKLTDDAFDVLKNAKEQGVNPRWALWEVTTGGQDERAWVYGQWMDARWTTYRAKLGIRRPFISNDSKLSEEQAHQKFDEWLASWVNGMRAAAED